MRAVSITCWLTESILILDVDFQDDEDKSDNDDEVQEDVDEDH